MPDPVKTVADQAETGAGTPRPCRVLLVDDHPLILKGIRVLIDGQSDMVCCGEATTAPEALAQAARTRPDIVVLDLSLPGNSGTSLIRDLKARHPNLPLLVLSMHDEALYAEKVVRAGAHGYVMKQDASERLLEGMRSVLKGEIFVSRQVASALLSSIAGREARGTPRSGVASLSDREMQVFESIGAGLTTRQTAEKYALSVKTIETYRAHIKRKLGLKTANDLIHAAVRWTEAESAGETS